MIVLAAGDELGRAITLRADPFAAPDVRLERLVVQDPVQHGRCQFLRAGRHGVAVKERLGLPHQRSQPLGVPGLQRGGRLVYHSLVDRP
jgi:hypothetical protein